VMHMTSSRTSSLDGLSGSGETIAKGTRGTTAETTVSREAARRDRQGVAIARRRQFSGSEKRRLLGEAAGRCEQASVLGWFPAA
jgi:hypothetical protein